jgi:Glutaredoxin
VKEFLSRAGHAFVERNVDEDPSACDEFLRRGWRAVPVTLVGDADGIRGFEPEALGAALAPCADGSAGG